MQHHWTKKEINIIIDLYPNNKTEDIAKQMNKTIKQIEYIAKRNKLHKTKEHISKMIGNRNKIVGRDLSIDNLTIIASQYISYNDFYNNDNSACQTINRLGLTEKLCGHMTFQNYSSPQLILKILIQKILRLKNKEILFNTRKIIYPYELDVYIPKYKLAFEYNGLFWHSLKNNDKLKQNKCVDLNILCLQIYEHKKKIISYIEDIKKQLIEKLNIINKHCNTTIKNIDIQNILNSYITEKLKKYIINEENILNETKKYNSTKEFKKK